MLVRTVIARSGEQRSAGNRIGRVEAGVVAHDVDEAANEQAGGGEEDHGEGYFDHKQSVAEQALFSCLGNAHGGGLKGIAEIETRAADGGSETEEERGEECQTDGEGEHPSIHVNRRTQLAEGKLQQLRDS